MRFQLNANNPGMPSFQERLFTPQLPFKRIDVLCHIVTLIWHQIASCGFFSRKAALRSFSPPLRKEDEVRKGLMSKREDFMGSRKQSGPLNNPHDLGKVAHSC